MCATCAVLVLATLGFLAGCGGSSAPAPVALTPAVPQVLNQGDTLDITAVVANDPSKKGVAWSLNPSTVYYPTRLRHRLFIKPQTR